MNEPVDFAPVPALAYATPAASRTNVAAACAVVFCGLALIVIGGCFLIGVMMVVSNGFAMAGSNGVPLLPRQVMLLLVLYLLAFVCFAVAGWLMFRGLRGLFQLMRKE